MKLKTLCVFGTRPEAIKMAPLVKKLNLHSQFHNKCCITGQHEQMLSSVLDLFGLVPDYNLKVMTPNQDLSTLTSKIILGLQQLFHEYTPDIVLVHGDTTTNLAAAIAAYYHRIPIAHVEAGLRTGNLLLPWPEEANRKLCDMLANFHFVPTQRARLNLLNEGIASDSIYITGNTVIDSLQEIIYLLDNHPEYLTKLQQKFSFISFERKIILVTGHRRESFGQGFENICNALAIIAKKFPQVDIVYPVHLNPNVQEPVRRLLGTISNVHLIEPVDYLSFVFLMRSSYLILTDSGGIQEEAPSLRKPVLVMREKTERPEALELGIIKLVGTTIDSIVKYTEMLLTDPSSYEQMCSRENPYGDGMASERILNILLHHFKLNLKQSDIKEEVL